MPKDLPRYTLRISRELLDKIAFIADSNSRSTNREIELLIKKHIAAYEQEKGQISL